MLEWLNIMDSADGWKVNFNWGDANAWKSDWDANDDSWVDSADFVFYTGHASLNGWLLVTPGTQNLVQLTPSVVGSVPANPGDKWGQQDLEWIIVAACRPLQYDILARGGGDVLTRWEGAFDGLQTLMGYGTITFDNTDEGRKVVQYSQEGTPVIDAWFRAAQEIPPSTNGQSTPDGPTVWVGAMYVTKPGADPRQDHIWGRGLQEQHRFEAVAAVRAVVLSSSSSTASCNAARSTRRMCRIELADRTALQHFGLDNAQQRAVFLASSRPWTQHWHVVRRSLSRVRMWAACSDLSFRFPDPRNDV